MTLASQDQQPVVAAQNAYRSDPAINAPNLQWDSTLATGAQSWADNLATNVHQLQHSDPSMRQGLGENIASATTGSMTAAQMADMWGSQEKPHFKPGIFPNVSKDGGTVGHYTQVIWKTTTNVGCGLATDSTTGNTYLVCRYSPAGNMSGVGVPATQPVPVAFVCCGMQGFAWGVDAANTVYQYFISGEAGTWTPVTDDKQKPVQMKQVGTAYDTGQIWGLDPSGGVYQQTASNSWTAAPGGAQAPGGISFQQLSVASSTSIWAIGSDKKFWQNNGTSWTQMVSPGGGDGGKSVSVAFDGTVWGLDLQGMIWQYANGTWTQMPGGPLVQISCGASNNIWAVGGDTSVWQYTTGWNRKAGRAYQISAGVDGMVWGVGVDNTIWRFVDNTQIRV